MTFLRHLLPCALPLLCLAPTAISQNQPAAQTNSTPTLKTSARLVLVDVVVTDSHQNPVHNLKAADFTLLENNAPQTLKAFEEHTAALAIEKPKLPPLPPGVVTNQVLTAPNGALNVLVLDTLNTPLQSQTFVHDQLLGYLKSPHPAASVAIFGLSTRLYMLQGFTADTAALQSAITHTSQKASPLLDDPFGGSGAQDPLSSQMQDLGLAPAEMIANLQDFEADQKSFQLQQRVRYTLDALNALARYLAGIPGRKNLIWFSGSFPIGILPDPNTTGNPFQGTVDLSAELRETTGLLSRAQVAVYPVDARGLFSSPSFNAANSGQRYSRNPANFNKDERDFSTQTVDEHSTMLQMAADTGGKAFINTNGLAQAVTSAINLGSNYYTLAFTPEASTKLAVSFRKIQLKLKQGNYTLAYRHGYYDGGTNDTPQNSTPNANDRTRVALTHGAPPATEIPFNARVLPSSATTGSTLATGNVLADSKHAKPPFRDYTITWVAGTGQLTYRTGIEGNYHGSADFLALLYDADGVLINSQANNVAADLTPAQYAKAAQGTLRYHQQISVPAAGKFYLRLAVRDRSGQKIGATEIPIAGLTTLPIEPATTNKP